MNKLTTQIWGPHRRKWTRKDNELAYIVILGATQQKEGIEKEWYKSGENFFWFKTTKCSLIKLGKLQNIEGFSDHEILKICQQIYRQIYQQNPNTVAETRNTG